MKNSRHQYSIEKMLRQKPKNISLFSTKIKRTHILNKEKVCLKCQKPLVLVEKRCKDKCCSHCAPLCARYRRLCRVFQNLPFQPSHLIQFVLPYPTIPLKILRPQHELHEALTKLRRQAWFKRPIKGGFYYIEIDINERWEARLHAHMILESYQSAASKPLDLYKADKAWRKLVDQHTEKIESLKKNTFEDANELFKYVTKQMRGERKIKALQHLRRYIRKQKKQLQLYKDTPPPQQDQDHIDTLNKNIRAAQQARVYIIKKINAVFTHNQRRAFFGTWRGNHTLPQAKLPRKLWCTPCRILVRARQSQSKPRMPLMYASKSATG